MWYAILATMCSNWQSVNSSAMRVPNFSAALRKKLVQSLPSARGFHRAPHFVRESYCGVTLALDYPIVQIGSRDATTFKLRTCAIHCSPVGRSAACVEAHPHGERTVASKSHRSRTVSRAADSSGGAEIDLSNAGQSSAPPDHSVRRIARRPTQSHSSREDQLSFLWVERCGQRTFQVPCPQFKLTVDQASRNVSALATNVSGY